ncbi:Avr1b-1 Avirulence-like protein [Phytophthora palmivora]|uniref:RxLR effector protein n=1 Tax=Phytophthora palmivora TaxID=4796 RepID=A0A2P4X300_9STRA|nr:Avr1b-1 Avirulence-like protein [Phytophthora palmivora]
MRLTFVLSVTILSIYFVNCDALVNSDETKTGRTTHPIHPVNAEYNDAVGKRFLRVHHEFPTEDRAFSISGLVKKWQAKNLAKELLNNPYKAQNAYGPGRLTDIEASLKVADPKKNGKKYDDVYNGYMTYLDIV